MLAGIAWIIMAARQALAPPTKLAAQRRLLIFHLCLTARVWCSLVRPRAMTGALIVSVCLCWKGVMMTEQTRSQAAG